MNKRNRIKVAIALLIGSVFIFPAASFAQNRLMIRLLDTVAKQSLNGYTRPKNFNPRMGNLEQEKEIAMNFKLTKGKNYGFAAVCDSGCNDIDVSLKDAKGQVIQEDNGEEDTAVVKYSPKKSGVYYLSVVMPSCEETDCAYGVGVYRK